MTGTKDFARDLKTNALINKDDKGYEAFLRERQHSKDKRILEDRLKRLEARIEALEEKNNV